MGQRSRPSIRLLALSLLPCIATVGCGEVQSSANEIGSASVMVTADGSPDFAFTTSLLAADGSISHPAGAVVTFGDWIWTRDGVDAGITAATVDPVNTTRGEVWQVSGVATVDGVPQPRAASQLLEIINIRPIVDRPVIVPQDLPSTARVCWNENLSLVPETFPTFDPDGDPLTFSYEWRVANVLVSTAAVLPASLTNVGDRVTAALEVNDTFVTTRRVSRQVRVSAAGDPAASNCPPLPPSPATAASGVSAPAPAASIEGATSGRAAAITTMAASAHPLDVSETGVCQLGADGAVLCSGEAGSALASPPEGVFTQVRVATDYACALAAEAGQIVCWGQLEPDLGQLAPPEGAFVSFDLASETACGLRPSGEIACWGDPTDGRTEAPAGTFVQVDVSDTWACAMDADGGVECWGSTDE